MNPTPAKPAKRALLTATPLLIALMSAALLSVACSTTPVAPPALVDARTTVRNAELDPAVSTHAPLELKKASDSLSRASMLLDKGESMAEVSHVAYLAQQQARTAMAIAKAKGDDAAIAGAQVDRERTRADMRAVEAVRAQDQARVALVQSQQAQAQASNAQAQANVAQAQAGAARQQAAASEQRASSAEVQTAVAQANASDAQQQSQQLQQRLADLQAQQTDRGMLVTLGDVLFETNRADVKPMARSSLSRLAGFLQQYPARRVLIEGHTDNIGPAGYNESLSLRRAEAVNAALSDMGVARQRLASIGYGEDYPVADNRSDTNRALNRRVEVYIADNDQPVRSRR